MEKKFWKPSVTTQFKNCPVPFHMDTYRGCIYDCKYCFARDLTVFARRNSENKEFSYLIGNRPDLFKKWMDRTIKSPLNHKKAHEVAFKERMPLKIGATADPFPPNEVNEKITYDILKHLHEIDYPVQMSTKNPGVLAKYAGDFDSPNWTVNVTLTSTDEKFSKIIEPNAPSPIRRFADIKTLTNMGIKVILRIQPFIYPASMGDIDALLYCAKQAGCWGFMTEGLKLRIAMPKPEQELIQQIGDYLNIDLRDYYKQENNRTGGDYELSDEHKKEFLNLFEETAQRYNLKFLNGDNIKYKVGSGCECCGTEVLRNYKILGCDNKSKLHGVSNEKISKELQKCEVNFTRSQKYLGKTIGDVCNEMD